MRGSRKVALIAFVLMLCVATAAYAAIYIYVTGAAGSRGVGGARLNMTDHTAARRIGISRTAGPTRDANYAGRAVWIWSFGRKMGDGRYPVRMYAYDNSTDTVFHFTVNSSAYKTTNGVGVGSSAATVKSKLPIAQTIRGSVYTIYRVKYKGGKPFSDFYVKRSTGKVHHVDIYR